MLRYREIINNGKAHAWTQQRWTLPIAEIWFILYNVANRRIKSTLYAVQYNSKGLSNSFSPLIFWVLHLWLKFSLFIFRTTRWLFPPIECIFVSKWSKPNEKSNSQQESHFETHGVYYKIHSEPETYNSGLCGFLRYNQEITEFTY